MEFLKTRLPQGESGGRRVLRGEEEEGERGLLEKGRLPLEKKE